MTVRGWIACVAGIAASALLWTACLESTHDVGCPSDTREFDHKCYPPDAKLPDGFDAGGPDLAPQCRKNGDCQNPTPLCDTNAGKCVACIPGALAGKESTDCEKIDPTKPICNSDETCHACVAHAQCDSQICIFDGSNAGSCASVNEVAYVDNFGTPTNVSTVACDTAHSPQDGSSAHPYCDLNEALSASTPWKYIVVSGSSQPYAAITLSNRSVTIVGPGRKAASPAQLVTATMSSVNMAVSSATTPTTVILDGLSLSGTPGGTHIVHGLDCNNMTGASTNANVVLRNSLIQLADNGGVLSTGCALTLDANLITQNQGGGIALNGGAYDVVNNLIVKNGPNAPGVALSSSFDAGSVFWFDTVAGNTTSSGIGGINCGGANAPPEIDASIIWGNTPVAGSSVNNCSFSHSDIDQSPTPGTGNFDTDPMFADTTLYEIKMGSTCIDKVMASDFPGRTLPDHDVDGNPRPRNGGWDIGANEVQ